MNLICTCTLYGKDGWFVCYPRFLQSDEILDEIMLEEGEKE